MTASITYPNQYLDERRKLSNNENSLQDLQAKQEEHGQYQRPNMP